MQTVQKAPSCGPWISWMIKANVCASKSWFFFSVLPLIIQFTFGTYIVFACYYHYYFTFWIEIPYLFWVYLSMTISAYSGFCSLSNFLSWLETKTLFDLFLSQISRLSISSKTQVRFQSLFVLWSVILTKLADFVAFFSYKFNCSEQLKSLMYGSLFDLLCQHVLFGVCLDVSLKAFLFFRGH